MRGGKIPAKVQTSALRSVPIRCHGPENPTSLYPPSRLARLETQVERCRIAGLAPIRSDLAQPFEQLGLDARGKLGSQLDRARGPSQDDAAFEPAEIIKEPRAARERRLRRTHHLEQQHQTVA